MKIGTKIIHFTFADIACSIMIIAGFVGLGYFEESLFRILSVCVSFCAILALFESLHHKLRYNIETNKFHIPKTNNIITTKIVDHDAKRVYVEQDSNSQESKTDNNNANKDKFVVVNRASHTNKTQPSTTSVQMHTYDINDSDGYNTGYKTFKVVPIDQHETPPAPETQPQTDTPHTDNTILKANISDSTTMEQEDLIEEYDEIVEIVTENKEIEYDNEQTETDIPEKALQTPHNNIDSLPNNIPNAEKVILSDYKKLDIDLPFSQIVDLEHKPSNSIEELDYVVSHLLMIIHDVLETNTVAFIWVNYESQMFIFDSYLSDIKTKDHIVKTKNIPFENDLLSEIARNAKPQILSQIQNPESELRYIPYYTQPVGTNSFIGLPVIHDNTVIAILCADTNKIHAYDEDVYGFLGNFTKLLSTLIGAINDNIIKENADKILTLLNNFNHSVTQRGGSFSDICNAITNFVVELYNCTSIGVVVYSQNKQIWNVCSYKSITPVDKNFIYTPISLIDTLVGTCIANAKPLVLQQQLSQYVRVNEYEPLLGEGAFIAMPIKSLTDCYGALFIESNDAHFISTIDMDILEALCNQTGIMLEKIILMQLFNKHVEREIKTNIMTERAFQRRVNEEVSRAIDETNTTDKPKLVIALVALDKYDSIAESPKQTLILNSIIELIRPKLKSFELVGRIKDDIIGLLLFNREKHQVKLTLESIRQKLATQYIEIDNTQYSATISVGINALNAQDTCESFTINATSALRYAQKKANYVQLFE